VGLAELLAAHGVEWRERALQADAAAARLGGTQVVLDYSSGWRETSSGGPQDAGGAGGTELIDFQGYAYTREPSPISGEPVTVYDPKTPQVWRVPFRDRVVPSLVVKAPLGGYVVPCAWAQDTGARLALHGIACEPVRAHSGVRVEAFRATQVRFAAAPFEGRMRVTLSGNWGRETQDIAAGALFVPIAQAGARLVMHLLEPQAPDSFAAWGFFNACFEHKESLEPYVAEQVARTVLAQHPQLQDEFSRKLEQDPAFAANPAARLEFFLRRHSTWDSHFNLYPIFRVDELLASAGPVRS
jgi:hypothetical protein